MNTTTLHTQETKMGLTLEEIAEAVGGELKGKAGARIAGVNALELATEDQIAFALSAQLDDCVASSKAGAFIVPRSFKLLDGRNYIICGNPRLAFARVVNLFWKPKICELGVHRSAVVSPDAVLGKNIAIAENVVIRPGAVIGDGTVIESGAHIGEGVTIGKDCQVGPQVTIRFGCHIGDRVILHSGVVIGSDGFGFVWDGDHHLKVPQIGDVSIEDDVELGANVCVDRAAFGSTIIRRGTKVDNLVQIAHNDVIGEHVILCGQVGLAGSVTIGDRSVLAGQVGVADHVTIGKDVQIGADSAVYKHVPDGQIFWGNPARPINKMKRELAALSFLPSLIKQFKALKESLR